MNKNNQSIKVEEFKDANSSILNEGDYLCIVKVDLGHGKIELLNIKNNTSPDELSYNFCLQHNLDFKSVKFLINKIKFFKENKIKENLLKSFNIINKQSPQSVRDSSLNKNNLKKILSNNTYKNENKINYKDNNTDINQNRDFNSTKNICIYSSSSSITPILSGYNSKNNSSDKNIYSNFFSPNTINKEKMTIRQIINTNTDNKDELNIISEKSQKYNYDNTNINNNTCNFNDSINDKLNNLERTYVNLNIDNKKVKSKTNSDSTIEVISEAIQNCMQIVEKEEKNNDNNITVSESNNNSEEIGELENKNKFIPLGSNDSLFEKNKSSSNNKFISTDRNHKDFKLYDNGFSTPKKQEKIYSENKLIEKKKKNFNKIANLNNDTINKNYEINSKNNCNGKISKKLNMDNISLQNINFLNKEINRQEKENNSKNKVQNELLKFSPENNSILNLNSNSIENNNNNINDNYTSITADNKFEKNKDLKSYINGKKYEIFNKNIVIKHEINFALLSTKSRRTYSYNHKYYNYVNNNKRSYKRIIKKAFTYKRSEIENGKKLKLYSSSRKNKNNNNYYNNTINKNSFYNLSDTGHNIKKAKKLSSIEIIKNIDDEKQSYYTLKSNKQLNNKNLLSFTMSDNNVSNKMTKNSKNKDNINRTTVTSLGNETNTYITNNSNIGTSDSTSVKLFSHKNLINSNVLNKISLNQTFNFSNELIFKRQKQKEIEKQKDSNSINSFNSHIINNSQNVYYANSTINNNTNETSSKKRKNNILKVRKNKRLIFSNNLNVGNSTYSTISSYNKDSSFDNYKYKTKNNFIKEYKNKVFINSKININDKKGFFAHHKLKSSNNLTENLITKNEIINSIKNIFCSIAKNNKILDVFTLVNKKDIPEGIYEIVKKIISFCDKKKRFVEYNEFICQAFCLFEALTNEEKITILNFNKENINNCNY